jgi:hypothetical protein
MPIIYKIDRSLHIYGIVTVVGMDKAIADVISMVTILHERKIGQHQGKLTKVYDWSQCTHLFFFFFLVWFRYRDIYDEPRQ